MECYLCPNQAASWAISFKDSKNKKKPLETLFFCNKHEMDKNGNITMAKWFKDYNTLPPGEAAYRAIANIAIINKPKKKKRRVK